MATTGARTAKTHGALRRGHRAPRRRRAGSSPGAVSSLTNARRPSSTGASPGDSARPAPPPRLRMRPWTLTSAPPREGPHGRRRRRRGRRRPRTDRRSCMSRSLLFVLLCAATPYHRTAAAGSLATPSPLKAGPPGSSPPRVAGLGALREISQASLRTCARRARPTGGGCPGRRQLFITLFRPLLQLAVRHRFRLAVGHDSSIERMAPPSTGPTYRPPRTAGPRASSRPWASSTSSCPSSRPTRRRRWAAQTGSLAHRQQMPEI